MANLPSHYYRLRIVTTSLNEMMEARAVCECTNTVAKNSSWSNSTNSTDLKKSPDFKIRARMYLDTTCLTGSHTLLTEEVVE